MNTLTNPIKTALALVVAMLLLAAGPTVAQDAHAHEDADAKKCPMMAEGAAMEDCPMKRDHDGDHHHHMHDAMHGDMEECPMMADGASMEDCPMMRNRAEGHDHSAHGASDVEALSVRAVAVTNDVQVIEIAVGPGGYEPAKIELEAGVTTHLIFTRTAEGGCVQQVQIPDLGVAKTDLPLGEAVTIEVTPEEAGTFRFACGMDMVSGTILVKE